MKTHPRLWLAAGATLIARAATHLVFASIVQTVNDTRWGTRLRLPGRLTHRLFEGAFAAIAPVPVRYENSSAPLARRRRHTDRPRRHPPRVCLNRTNGQ